MRDSLTAESTANLPRLDRILPIFSRRWGSGKYSSNFWAPLTLTASATLVTLDTKMLAGFWTSESASDEFLVGRFRLISLETEDWNSSHLPILVLKMKMAVALNSVISSSSPSPFCLLLLFIIVIIIQGTILRIWFFFLFSFLSF